MFFRFFLKQKTEVLVLGQRISILQIVKFGKTAKSIFFEFYGSYELIVAFFWTSHR